MNCYLCFVEDTYNDRPAHAMCQRCGVGVCADHLVEMRSISVHGMVGNSGSGRRMMCGQCYTAIYPQAQSCLIRRNHLSESQRCRWNVAWNVARWFKKKSGSDLPTPEEVIAEAELLLKQQHDL